MENHRSSGVGIHTEGDKGMLSELAPTDQSHIIEYLIANGHSPTKAADSAHAIIKHSNEL